MQHIHCPYCSTQYLKSEARSSIKKAGFFYRKSDRKWIQKFFCLNCKRSFSQGRSHPAFRQKKRHLNTPLLHLLCSGVSQRRAAKLLKMSRTTVARKLCYLGSQADKKLQKHNSSYPKSEIIEFDDQETFEHTKCKPLSITLAVEHRTRRILGFEVSRMPAKGKLVRIALKKYGPRKDERSQGREKLFTTLQNFVVPSAVMKSDENPHYPQTIKKYFPKACHQTFKGQRGSIVGQGELKKIRFDPLFSLNHTCAMLRDNVNRLARRTWATTKKPDRLRLHLAIYAVYHNTLLI